LAQTAVANAQTALENTLAAQNIARQSALNTVIDAYASADDAVHNYSDRLFNDPKGPNPLFEATITGTNGVGKYQITENDVSKKLMINSARKEIEMMLGEWKELTKNLSSEHTDSLPALLSKTIDNLQYIQNF